MRILYLSISYVPSRSASSVHAMKMCAALARAGHDVELVTKGTPQRQEPGVDDVFEHYGVDRFRVTPVSRPPHRGGGLVYLGQVSRLLRERRAVDLVYSRDLVAAWRAAAGGHRVIFEAHGLPQGLQRWFARRLVRAAGLQRLVFISRALEELWRSEGLLDAPVQTLVAHDAADPMPTGESSTAGASGPLRAGYVGHLYGGRGVELILAVARALPEVEFHLVGGRERELAAWQAQAVPRNVQFHGFVPPGELPALYRGFDVLLMPYQRSVSVRSGASDTARWMSPMKMFEYMATGKAIVSSDLPVLREVLEHDANALLVDPEDASAWVEALKQLAREPALRARLGERALADFERHYTWSARAESVLAGIRP
jgi:glycosyltransferase involved in cell wall biosynthesis